MHIDFLPDHVLENIFDHLPLQDLLNIHAVCKRFSAPQAWACRRRQSILFLDSMSIPMLHRLHAKYGEDMIVDQHNRCPIPPIQFTRQFVYRLTRETLPNITRLELASPQNQIAFDLLEALLRSDWASRLRTLKVWIDKPKHTLLVDDAQALTSSSSTYYEDDFCTISFEWKYRYLYHTQYWLRIFDLLGKRNEGSRFPVLQHLALYETYTANMYHPPKAIAELRHLPNLEVLHYGLKIKSAFRIDRWPDLRHFPKLHTYLDTQDGHYESQLPSYGGDVLNDEDDDDYLDNRHYLFDMSFHNGPRFRIRQWKQIRRLTLMKSTFTILPLSWTRAVAGKLIALERIDLSCDNDYDFDYHQILDALSRCERLRTVRLTEVTAHFLDPTCDMQKIRLLPRLWQVERLELMFGDNWMARLAAPVLNHCGFDDFAELHWVFPQVRRIESNYRVRVSSDWRITDSDMRLSLQTRFGPLQWRSLALKRSLIGLLYLRIWASSNFFLQFADPSSPAATFVATQQNKFNFAYLATLHIDCVDGAEGWKPFEGLQFTRHFWPNLRCIKFDQIRAELNVFALPEPHIEWMRQLKSKFSLLERVMLLKNCSLLASSNSASDSAQRRKAYLRRSRFRYRLRAFYASIKRSICSRPKKLYHQHHLFETIDCEPYHRIVLTIVQRLRV